MSLLRALLVWIVIALLGALAAQLLMSGDPGYVLVRRGGVDYTTTVINAIAMLLGAMVVVWLLVTLILLPFRSWGRYRETKAQSRVGEGLDALHQGHYARAEKLLAQSADENPHYEPAARIAATQAAIGRGDDAGARAHLERFGDRHPATRAIALAELALLDDRPIDALTALDAPAAQPLPPRGLALRADAWAMTGHAAEAYGLLGALRRQNALSDAQLEIREIRWAAASLHEAADANVLAERWESLPKHIRTETPVVLAYADRAVALGWPARRFGLAAALAWASRSCTCCSPRSTAREPAVRVRVSKLWPASVATRCTPTAPRASSWRSTPRSWFSEYCAPRLKVDSWSWPNWRTLSVALPRTMSMRWPTPKVRRLTSCTR